MSGMGNPLELLPEMLLLTGAVGGLLLGMWTPQRRQGRVAVVAVLLCLASAALSAAALAGPDVEVFHGTWLVDTITGVVRVVVALGAAVAVLLCRSSLKGRPRETEAYVLVLLAAIGSITLAASGDVLVLMAAYLLASIPLYALVGMQKDSRGVEATLKYFLMGAFVGIVMLLGITALVLGVGRSRYDVLAAVLPDQPTPIVAVGVLGVLAGLAFKAGAVPLHFWVPDVTAGTTPAIAAFITTIPKIGALAAVFRLMDGPFADVPLDVPLVVAVIATASMTLGNLAAFAQDEVLRLLAYSTISQVGYVLMVVAVADRTDLALPALAIYLAAYTVANIGAFAAAAAAPEARTIAEWSAAAGHRRWLVLSLVICLLGLVGTPPTAVFVGKLAAFLAAADGGLAWLVVVAAVNTVASLFYYLRWIVPAFGGVGGGAAGSAASGGPGAVLRLPVVVVHGAAAGSIVLGVAAGWYAAGIVG